MVPVRRTSTRQARKKGLPTIDISYVELPDRVTHWISLGGVLGGASLLSMVLAPAAVEGEAYILAVALVAACGICAGLAEKEDGKKR